MSDFIYQYRLISSDNQPIEITKETLVGRGDACDLIIKTGQISRQHAKLTPTLNGLWVEDLNSSNGTFINDQRLQQKTLITHMDMLRFDTVIYQFQQESLAESITEKNSDKVDSDSVTRLATPAQQIKPQPKPTPAVAAPTSVTPQPTPVVATEATPKRDAITPPAWAMQRQQSVDGTELLDAPSAQSRAAQAASNKPALLEKVDQPTLIGKNESIAGQRFLLQPTGASTTWEVGRADTAAVVINHGSVSTSHAQIVNEGQRWKLVDMVSANGTFVNDVKGLTTYLKHGDLLRFGQVECQFLLPVETKSAAAHVTTAVVSNKPSSKKGLVALIGIVVLIAIAVVVLTLTKK